MPTKFSLNPVSLTHENSLKTLVENRTAYTLNKCELNIFETHATSNLVPLTFNDFVVTSMLRGKKVMHLLDAPGFDYLPGESVLVPAGITMKIDFPEAEKNNATQCIALAIDNQKIESTLNFLNEKYPKTENNYWQFQKNNYHFFNNIELAQVLNKLVKICMDGSSCKEIFADLTLQELIVNIVQLQNLNATDAYTKDEVNNNPLSFVTGFIRANIGEEIKLEDLTSKACMSKATFYRSFKREFGISPIEFIQRERIKKAKQLLADTNYSVKAVCLESGFSDVNYFVRVFKMLEGITPKQYQMVCQPNTIIH